MRGGHEALKHDLPLSTQVFFVLDGDLTKARLMRALRCIDDQADSRDGLDPDGAWESMRRRAGVGQRWGELVPWPEGDRRDLNVLLARREAANCLKNIERVRRLPTWSMGDLRIGVDLFNPRGELGLGYVGEGETVVSLLLEREDGGHVGDLVARDHAWRLIRSLRDALLPSTLCGTWSIANYAIAQREGRAQEESPWKYMFPLHLLKRPRHLSNRERLTAGREWTSTNDSLLLLWPVLRDPGFAKAPMAKWFGRVEVWDEESVLVLVSGGLDGVIRPEYRLAAQALGMTSIVELIPGAYS